MDTTMPIPVILAEYAREYKKARDIIVDLVLETPDRMPELWQAIAAPPSGRAMMAAMSAFDYITRKNPSLAQAYKDPVLALDFATLPDSAARHYANIIGKLDLDDSSHERACQTLYDLFQSDRAVAIRVFALQSLFDLMKHSEEGRARLRKLLGFAGDEDRPAMRARARNLLDSLDKMEKA